MRDRRVTALAVALFVFAVLRRSVRLVVIAAALSAASFVATTAGGMGRPEVSAARTQAQVRVDGILDEPAWVSAGVIALKQQAPRPGEPMAFQTEVRFLVDDASLYVGFTCTDPDPSRLAAHTMQRDGDMTGDDSVAIAVDPFGDGRNGYVFRVNVAGARLDGLIAGADATSLDWDGIWEAKTIRTRTGWTAELRIPAQTLRFTAGQDTWGLEVERFIPRVRTTLRWSGRTLDSKFDDFKRAGNLRGLSGLKQGLGLSVSPFALGRLTNDFDAGTGTFKGGAGLDVGYNVTPQLNAVLTLNTDFAETEVDTRQINLTRFPLFFPEKRSFFLEGSNLFQFGLGLGTDFIPFYSRRVGLVAQQVVPLDGGVKVLGRAGAFGIALVDVETRQSDVAPRTNLFAGRFTYDLDSHLRVGTIVTRGDPEGHAQNSLVGLDAVWQTSSFQGDKDLRIGLWGVRSGGETAPGQGTGWGLRVDYPNDLWNTSLDVKELGEALHPALGFLPRPGIRSYDLYTAFQPRPERGPFSWVRQFFFEVEPHLVTDLSGGTESFQLFMAPFNVRTQSGEHIEANWSPEFERIDVPFEVAPGVVIPVGRYDFSRFRLEAQSSDHRRLRAGATVWFGGFYGGTLTQLTTYVSWTSPAAHLQAELDGENDYGSLPEGRFITRLWQLRSVYSFSPDLILSANVQYDTESRSIGVNARLRWTIRPGAELFLVWNRGWREIGDAGYRLAPQAEEVVLKVRWTLRQ